MDKNHHISQVLNLVLAALLLIALAITTYSINQARSLQSEAKGKPSGNSATLTVSPDPVPVGAEVTITGSAFTPGPVVVAVDWSYPYETVTADSSGNFTYVFSRPLDPGLHGVLAYQEGKGKKGMELKAYTSFTVEP
ncbi:MAG: hypothetical protein A2172_01660 [Candidatus Woykebacteria bacterium RBG_13_40_15]|uniref:Bacterial Ig-like domain-containing protein n=1 Tax=Candidatus Woykebacteria bacterium RBG_13_40_15 TaxID=1802593 RepID=A0A1G1WAU9_9BACT|nr:MAG: hypothetical protein A2172_01660 [Candidatus Woykebacteria bacterium RBG_13_40_15]